SPRRPGLVLGLDAGGVCDGLAFRIAPGQVRATRAYLRAREQVTRVYLEAMRPIHLAGGRASVRALCYHVDQRHPQYAGRLPLALQAHLVRRSRGRSGRNIDYVANTVRHLAEMGIEDRALLRILPLAGIRNAGH
ncbi:MAG: gamma-glutamylcyclotransferase, partial [Alphaproteobacteria bacterium]